jgi:hypothetical protein
MRKLIFLFTILISSQLFAQKTFHGGILAGVNGSQIQGDNASGFNSAGLVAGGFICTDPTQKWYGQMELQYSHKGSHKFANPDAGDYNTFEIRMNYVEAPFLARYNAKKFYFEIGETLGILGKVREWDTNGELTPQGYRRWETALVVGGGYALNDHWLVDVRYTNSVLPVKKFPFPVYDPRFFFRFFNKGLYNNVLGLTLCYRFEGKDKSGE